MILKSLTTLLITLLLKINLHIILIIFQVIILIIQLVGNLYYSLLNKNKGDIILSISNLNNPINEKYNFDINYCFSGLNKNNYNFSFLHYIDLDLLTVNTVLE